MFRGQFMKSNFEKDISFKGGYLTTFIGSSHTKVISTIGISNCPRNKSVSLDVKRYLKIITYYHDYSFLSAIFKSFEIFHRPVQWILINLAPRF